MSICFPRKQKCSLHGRSADCRRTMSAGWSKSKASLTSSWCGIPVHIPQYASPLYESHASTWKREILHVISAGPRASGPLRAFVSTTEARGFDSCKAD